MIRFGVHLWRGRPAPPGLDVRPHPCNSTGVDQLRLAALMAGLGPVLLAQGRDVRRRTPLLPTCPDVSETEPGAAPPLKLGLLGDSIVAGVGVQNQREGLCGRLAHHLARRTGRAVEWRTRGLNGARARDLVHLSWEFEPDLLVVSVGVNDVLNLTGANTFRRHLQHLSQRWPVPLVLAGLPDFASYPSLPRPLRDVLAWRARRLQQAVPEPWVLFRLEGPMRPEDFSPDLFHPGPAGCDAWASALVEAIGDGHGLGQRLAHGRRGGLLDPG